LRDDDEDITHINGTEVSPAQLIYGTPKVALPYTESKAEEAKQFDGESVPAKEDEGKMISCLISRLYSIQITTWSCSSCEIFAFD
jgi:hypothetical protein